MQVIAVSHAAGVALPEEAARVGCRLLGLAGLALEAALRECGILCSLVDPATKSEAVCTMIHKVNEIFHGVRYVIVAAPGTGPWPRFRSPMCTCPHFGRYAGCEHAEFVKMLDLRLRPATSFPEALPVLRRKGRKPGVNLTMRGAALKEKTKVKRQVAAPKAKA